MDPVNGCAFLAQNYTGLISKDVICVKAFQREQTGSRRPILVHSPLVPSVRAPDRHPRWLGLHHPRGQVEPDPDPKEAPHRAAFDTRTSFWIGFEEELG